MAITRATVQLFVVMSCGGVCLLPAKQCVSVNIPGLGPQTKVTLKCPIGLIVGIGGAAQLAIVTVKVNPSRLPVVVGGLLDVCVSQRVCVVSVVIR